MNTVDVSLAVAAGCAAYLTFIISAFTWGRVVNWLSKVLGPVWRLITSTASNLAINWFVEMVEVVIESVAESFVSKLLLDDTETKIFCVDIAEFESQNRALWATDSFESQEEDVVAGKNSKFLFRFENSLIFVRIYDAGSQSSPRLETEISGLCSISKLNEFLNHIEKVSDEIKKQRPDYCEGISVHRHDSDGDWVHSFVAKRSIESVFLPPETIEGCCNAIDKFSGNKNKMKRLGIPHRMGILLKGVPGSGKTSLVRALAGHYDSPIFTINLGDADLTDSALLRLVDGVSEGSIILIEDLSALRAARIVQNEDDEYELPGVSLSGLLNAIDGIHSPDDVIFFFTANESSKIDPAMRRAGRIDLEFEFKNATSQQSSSMFKWFYSDCDGVEGMSERFVSAIGDRECSMSELLFVIRNNIENPQAAIDGVAEYLDSRAKPSQHALKRRARRT